MNHPLSTICCALGLALAGCPPEEANDAGADAGAGHDAAVADSAGHDAAVFDSAGHDSARPDSAGTDAGVPILQRPSTHEVSCTRSHDSAALDDAQWWGEALVASNGSFYLARGVGDYYASDLEFSTITLAGALGTMTPIADLTTTSASTPSMVEDGANLALVWAENDSANSAGKIRFAIVGTAGQQITAPHDVAGSSDYATTLPLLFKTSAGFALFWIGSASSTSNALKYLTLDATGNAVGSPVTLASMTDGYVTSPAVVPISGGFAVAYSTGSWGNQVVKFVTIDSAGSKNFTEKQISNSGFSGDSPTLIEDGGDYIAAWSEYYSSGMDTAWRVVQVAHVDGEGNLIGPRHLLQPSGNLVTDETPQLFDLGGDVALTWSHGTFTLICAGCMPDNKLQLVVLDRSTLVPQSNVAEIVNTEMYGGLTRPVIARQGMDFLAVYDITLHVSAYPGSGAFHCQ